MCIIDILLIGLVLLALLAFGMNIARNNEKKEYNDGICTNPQMDCINCPKRGTGGTWSTSTNKVKEE